MPAEIVVRIEDQDRGVRALLAVEPGGGEPSEPGADDDEIVGLLDGKSVDRDRLALAGERVDRGEGGVGGASEPGEAGRVGPGRSALCGELVDGGECARDRQRHTVEEIASCDPAGHCSSSPMKREVGGPDHAVRPQARTTNGSRFHPESCRLIW